jgi:predicted O-methyltransferase YrrM
MSDLLGGLRRRRAPRPATVPRGMDVTADIFSIDMVAADVVRWTPASMTGSGRLLLYALALALRPDRYLEIGVQYGGSALLVASAMNALQSPGRLVGIDPEPQIMPEVWQILEPRMTLLRGRSPDSLPAAAEAAGAPFDLVLIDGAHTYDSLLADAEGVWPLLANDAHLLFHDSHNHEVDRAINAFLRRHRSQVADAGTLSRDFTIELGPGGHVHHWAGLRLLRVRR